ncbi:unnamed protein product, partial [Ixodes hexagonus]
LIDSDDPSCNGTTEDPFKDYWKKVCSKAYPRHMGIFFVTDTEFQNKQAETGFSQSSYLETFVETVHEQCQFERFKNTTESGEKSLDATLTLGLFKEWANEQTFFNNSDVVYLISGHPVFDFLYAYRLKMKAASYSFGVCSKRKVALGSDDGLFSGVPAAVQQIAHLLGISWDERRSEKGCTPDDGYVMSKNGEPTKYPTFSNCSRESWDILILTSLGQTPCFKLNNTSTTNSSESKTPYSFFQCEGPCNNITLRSMDFVTDSPQEGIEIFQKFDACQCSCCPKYAEYLNGTKNGAPDGMPCGSSKVCLQEVCINVTRPETELTEASST